jgi:hypothetical protein
LNETVNYLSVAFHTLGNGFSAGIYQIHKLRIEAETKDQSDWSKNIGRTKNFSFFFIFHYNTYALNSLQCFQMVYFQTKNPNSGKFWKVLQLKLLVILWPLCLVYGEMVYFRAIWYILIYFFRFGMLYREKSGNPE